MAKNAMGVNLRQSIIKSLGRYIAIVLIIALGSGIFVGLLMTKSDMVLTGQEVADHQNMFDLRMISTLGWSDRQIDMAARLPGVSGAEGILYTDLMATVEDSSEINVFRFYAMPEQMNQINLVSGRLPEKGNECIADSYIYGESILGSKVRLSLKNDPDTLDEMNYRKYTVVGCALSPLYMDMNRGTTSIGSGSLTSFFYLPKEAFDVEYYTEMHLTIPGDHVLYSKAYHDLLDSELDRLEGEADRFGTDRYEQIKEDALAEYRDGYEEYLDGLEEYREGKLEFQQEIDDARKELEDAEEEIKKTIQQLNLNEQRLTDAQMQILGGQNQLDAQEAQLKQQQAGASAALDAIPGQISGIEQQIAQLDPDNENYDADKATLEGQIYGLTAQQGYLQGLIQQTIPAGFQQIDSARKDLAYNLAEVEAGLRQVWTAWGELHKAEDELKEAWEDFEEGKREGEQELADAKEELQEAQQELQDAWEDIQDIEPPEVYVLDRTSNIGYNSLDSASDIVAGVSRVIPVFFLLVASLVCITTMTRMIDEERTQIGTLKALGYSNGAIISKYLIYAGSGAVIGCGVGVCAGSIVFPKILWDAYKIMLCVRPDVSIAINWLLCAIVVVVYTSVMLLVTWYCCRKALQEVPAELIRPKAPDPGKSLWVEKIPLWNRVSFLNKVMVRNIFRYKQRLAMMLVGIGGCTALLVTGYGLRDSIVGIVDYQFDNVTIYDLEVYFNDGQSQVQQAAFLQEVDDKVDSGLFFHQSSVDLEFGGVTKEIYMISAENVEPFIHLYQGDTQMNMPGVQEVLLSSGVAEAMGLRIGDSVLMRNADMQTLELTLSGIYENHVYNYGIVLPQTISECWGEEPEQQMAYLKVVDGVDIHSVSAQVSEIDHVMNVTVSEDVASMVGKMMQALDMVVVVIVFCAGLLAAIVLYNLTNININERVREIATIKVLGFNARETAAYVFKENLTLTIAGSLTGLVLGKLLLLFVMDQVKIDMVWFKTMIEPMSYVWSVLLTLVASFVVDFLFYFKLDKINMAEALKSVE